MPTIPMHFRTAECEYLTEGCCYWCCETCNRADHRCPGCGTDLDHNGLVAGVKHEGCTG